jgi:hypothetical protein|tara:strand:+ start:124 stop:282 length:159 start_codon:yes stop_codon:yes gene_type:complete
MKNNKKRKANILTDNFNYSNNNNNKRKKVTLRKNLSKDIELITELMKKLHLF